ncbi:MAG: hypothetical protein K2N67_05425 [Mucispirillum sp.]|nr:hypothetical protein [Mucispirillum sp.]
MIKKVSVVIVFAAVVAAVYVYAGLYVSAKQKREIGYDINLESDIEYYKYKIAPKLYSYFDALNDVADELLVSMTESKDIDIESLTDKYRLLKKDMDDFLIKPIALSKTKKLESALLSFLKYNDLQSEAIYELTKLYSEKKYISDEDIHSVTERYLSAMTPQEMDDLMWLEYNNPGGNI